MILGLGELSKSSEGEVNRGHFKMVACLNMSVFKSPGSLTPGVADTFTCLL